jgi:hypothetical protein
VIDKLGQRAATTDLMIGASADNIQNSRAVGAVGYETSGVNHCNDKHLAIVDSLRAAWLSAVGETNPPIDTDLQVVVGAWAKLPEAVKAGIVAMVTSTAISSPRENKRQTNI